MTTILQILKRLINEDCARYILSILRKSNYKDVLREFTIESKHLRLQNYVLQSKAFVTVPVSLSTNNQIYRELYYWGSPYHFSNVYIKKKRKHFNRSEHPVARLITVKESLFDDYIIYYHGFKNPKDRYKLKVPIFQSSQIDFTYSVGSRSTVFTKILDYKRWWQLDFYGFLYTFRKYNYISFWEYENDEGHCFVADSWGIYATSKEWLNLNNDYNNKDPDQYDLKKYLVKLCSENNLEGWEKYSIKDLFNFLMLNLN